MLQYLDLSPHLCTAYLPDLGLTLASSDLVASDSICLFISQFSSILLQTQRLESAASLISELEASQKAFMEGGNGKADGNTKLSKPYKQQEIDKILSESCSPLTVSLSVTAIQSPSEYI